MEVVVVVYCLNNLAQCYFYLNLSLLVAKMMMIAIPIYWQCIAMSCSVEQGSRVSQNGFKTNDD